MELRVLGPLELVGENGPVSLPAAKHRRLLVALALADGKARSTDALIDAVWGELPPASARKLLQVYISQLRKALPAGARIVTQTAGYALELPPDAVDATRFERLVKEGRSAAADGSPALAASLHHRALALWRGAVLADVANADATFPDASRLEELRLSSIEDRIAAELELGRHDETLSELTSLVKEHPLRERLRAHQMLALYRSGRQAEALEAFQDARRALVDELGLEPGPELRSLQQRVLEQDPTLDETGAGERASVLPAPPGPLVGRQDELDALRALLGRGDVRLVVLTGAGGSGKTRLALEAARELAETYADGAVLVELGSLSDPELVVPTIAREVGVGEAGAESPIDTLVAALASRELLLVIDNAEHLRAAAPAYVRLLRGAPRLTLLITSRAVLHLTGEHVFPVAPLEEDDALELFVRRARAANPSFVLTEDVEPDLRAICSRVDCLPLAVELAAARTAMLEPRSLLERLSSRLTLLTGGPRDLPARQQTLRETLDWSVNLLNDDERRSLARLSVFAGGCTLDAAEMVCEAELDTLAALVDSNLVRRVDVGHEPRYTMLETIREHASELLANERRQAELRHLEYFVDLAERADFRGPEAEVWLTRFDAELDNLRMALDLAASRPDCVEAGLRLAGNVWRYWWVRGLLSEGRARLAAALARDGRAATQARAVALNGAAGLALTAGDYDAARRLATEALEITEGCAMPLIALTVHTILGLLASRNHDFAGARTHHESSRSLALAHGSETDVVVATLNLGVIAQESGDSEGALPYFEEVLSYRQREHNVEGIGFAHLNLGLTRFRLGALAAARGHFVEAFDAFGKIGFREHVGHALQGLAAVEAGEGEYLEAARCLGRAEQILTEVGASLDEFDSTLALEIEAAAREALGADAFAQAVAEGRATPIDTWIRESRGRDSW